MQGACLVPVQSWCSLHYKARKYVDSVGKTRCVGTKHLKATEPGAWFHRHDICQRDSLLYTFCITIFTCLPGVSANHRHYPPAFGIKMVEAAEGHAVPLDATTIPENDPPRDLAIFRSLNFDDMWDDVHCSVLAMCSCTMRIDTITDNL